MSKKLPMMSYEDFFEIVKCYPCLFNKSQTPKIKCYKLQAIHAIKAKIQKVHGVSLDACQIKKKLENMKMRAKMRRERIQNNTDFPRQFEEELFKLMYSKNSAVEQKHADPNSDHLDVSLYADNNCFKYEIEDAISQDEVEQINHKFNPPQQTPEGIFSESEIKLEPHETYEIFEIESNSFNDTYYSSSEEEYEKDNFDKSEDKTKTTSFLGIKDKYFFDIIKCYDCLFERSRDPKVKELKRKTLEVIRNEIQTLHGINLSHLQIRRNLNNMKEKIQRKLYISMTKNSPKFKLKPYERQFLEKINLKNLTDQELCGEPNTTDDSNNESEVQHEAPNNFNSIPKRNNEKDEIEQLSILAMKKEVLLEQKELNRQQIELNKLQKEILTLKKEKLLLEIDELKKRETA